MGDEVQAIKAGILECADVFAVNKSDRDGAQRTVSDLELMIALGKSVVVNGGSAVGHIAFASEAQRLLVDAACNDTWTPPIVQTVATRNEGISELVHWLAEHQKWLRSSTVGAERMRLRLQEQMHWQMREALIDAAIRDIGEGIDEAVEQVAQRKLDPYSACEQLVDAFRRRHRR
jgi:LAO/AO transport system kinase